MVQWIGKSSKYWGYLAHVPARNPKKNYPEKTFFIFPKKNFFLIFRYGTLQPQALNIFYIFLKKIFLMFPDGTFRCKAQKTKKKTPWKSFLHFSEKKLLLFQDDCWSSRKIKKISYALGWLLIKRKKISYTPGWP